jgi:hypothetical protein
MLFNPDLDALLRSVEITKPQEEFELSPPRIELADENIPVEQSPLEPLPTLGERLAAEAASLQEFHDLIVETAEPAIFPVPDEEKYLLGDRITTDDYLQSIGSDDHKARRMRNLFEQSLLGGCGSHPGWPIVALPDLAQLRDTLLGAADLVEGRLLAATPIASTVHTAAITGSHVAVVHDELIQSARSYRAMLARSILAGRNGLGDQFLRQLTLPVLSSGLAELRPLLKKLRSVLQLFRAVLCKAQLFRLLNYSQLRDALLAVLVEAIVRQLLDALVAALSEVQQKLVAPVLDLFENGFAGSPFLQIVGDEIGRQFGSVVGATLVGLTRQYTDLAADLIRAVQKERDLRLAKLQILGERNVVGRWIQHLDQGISVIDRALLDASLAEGAVRRLSDQLLKPLAHPVSRVYARVSEHPSYEEFVGQPFAMSDTVGQSATDPGNLPDRNAESQFGGIL